jgi:predicted transcriptional regulator
MDGHVRLSRRERDMMAAVFARGEASAAHVLDAMLDPPTKTAVRTMLRNLVEKGHLSQRKNGRELFYTPTSPRDQAGQSAIRRVLSLSLKVRLNRRSPLIWRMRMRTSAKTS